MKLTIQETQLILNVLDVASSRGAFRGAEMLSIGTLHQRLAESLPKEPTVMGPTTDEAGEE